MFESVWKEWLEVERRFWNVGFHEELSETQAMG